MLTLYSYPTLFGVADNNGYGLKVFAFLKLTGVPFIQRHTFDASQAPRKQLPYIVDDGEALGDSDTIIAHLIRRYGLTIDAALSAAARDTAHLIGRMLDDLYWVMSYSRWKDEEFWPAFRDALRSEHPSVTDAVLDKAREYNSQRYYYQGIGRFAPAAAYARGLADLQVLADLVPPRDYMFGPGPTRSTPASTGSSPIFIFTRSRRRSRNSSLRRVTWFATALRSTGSSIPIRRPIRATKPALKKPPESAFGKVEADMPASAPMERTPGACGWRNFTRARSQHFLPARPHRAPAHIDRLEYEAFADTYGH